MFRSTNGKPCASFGHLNQTNFPHSVSPHGVISISMRLLSCNHTPTGVAICAPAGVAASHIAVAADHNANEKLENLSMAPRVLGPGSEIPHLKARYCSGYGEHIAGALRRGRSRRHKAEPSQCGERLRTCFLHDRGAMVLDGAAADSKVRGDVLARVALQDQIHDLVLPRRQTRAAICEWPLTRRLACSLCSIRNGRHSFTKQGFGPRQSDTEPGFLQPVYRKLAFEVRDCAIDIVSSAEFGRMPVLSMGSVVAIGSFFLSLDANDG